MTDITKPDGLECDHCGDTAIDFKPPAHNADYWHLHDGDGEFCASCGFPGHVTIDDDGDPEDNSCRWMVNDWDDGLKCNVATCEDCFG